MSNLNKLIDKLTNSLSKNKDLKYDTKDILKQIFDLEKTHLHQARPNLKSKIKTIINHAAEKRFDRNKN